MTFDLADQNGVGSILIRFQLFSSGKFFGLVSYIAVTESYKTILRNILCRKFATVNIRILIGFANRVVFFVVEFANRHYIR